MIADSPYRADEPIVTSGQGALGGIVASMLMLLVILLLQALSGPSAGALLIRIARTVLPGGAALRPGSMLIAGAAIYVLVGALLGLLYAVSQDRAPARALIAVGVVYGFLIWLGSRAVTSWIFGSVFRAAFHSYAWFVACLTFGALLAGYALWVDRHRPPAAARTVPVD